ncbi:hypothetical protein PPL_11836 [Heterostelium album PN500]|uniref:Calcineurin-like phosphoesterase domain-containing protein n=1 Tax=Heterostelium pallidum (strain ATCC 26659 / Pp 5 / PN500) TaxID=670386 RepID=D3BUL5_HETP5|nr:hypothetical protein PPL_11836 [Heterostelium album PN500]EFA74803.1 hypothetical protein PPL_11836 [Heterostelium album PN500]|eukprot:XP_020426937.1 hypothetical protein PPL_11836 [Heterostelium album PN500]
MVQRQLLQAYRREYQLLFVAIACFGVGRSLLIAVHRRHRVCAACVALPKHLFRADARAHHTDKHHRQSRYWLRQRSKHPASGTLRRGVWKGQFKVHVAHHTGESMIREQSMLTKETTQYILDEIKPIYVFNGHDHDGCIYKHNNHTIEYTIRSMMGEFGGYSALFEIRKPNPDIENFEYSFKICPFIQTKFINISFGVTGGWLVLFIIYNLILSFIRCYHNQFKKSSSSSSSSNQKYKKD